MTRVLVKHPQGSGERLPQENWSCTIYLGETNLDKGKYDIAVVVVNDKVHIESGAKNYDL
jgi:hypothetical protein